VINAILDLCLVVQRQTAKQPDSILCLPLALSSLKFELDIINGVRRTVLAAALFLCDELLPEHVIVRLAADFVYHDFLLVVGDLVDDVFWPAAPQLELIELGHAFRVDRET
jgi:hypothetical protein